MLEQIKQAAVAGTLTKQELTEAYDAGLPGNAEATSKRRMTFSESIQYLGSGIVFIGIALLIGENWNTLSTAARILTTFGSALVAFAISIALLRKEVTHKLGLAFILISILLMPVGVYTIFDALGIKFITSGQQLVYEVVVAVIYIAARWATRLRLYIIPITFFATALFFTLTGMLFSNLSSTALITFTEYRFLIVGLSYMLFGYFFTQKQDRIFASFFYIFGVIGLLTSAMFLSGFGSDKNTGQTIWEIFYPILVFLAMYFSVFVKQTKILVFSALFLMADVIKVSGEYFSNSLGWPLAVVIAGLLMIAVGYLSVYLNRKYIKQTVA